MTRHAVRYVLPLVAAVSLQLTACGEDAPGAASPGPTGHRIGLGDFTSSSPSHEASSTPASQWKLLEDEPDGASLAAGAYGLTANGVSHHVAVVRAPEGYQGVGGWTFITGAPFHAMGFVTAGLLPPDPCGTAAHDKFDTAVDPGPSVRDLADALVAQKGADTSEPVPVVVGGRHGLFLTYRVAKGIDVRRCGDRAFDIFTTGPGSWWLEESRERAAIWILDVDGDRVVLAWVAVPGVTRPQLREMTRMVRSAHFIAS
jgi:hypothetical protein